MARKVTKMTTKMTMKMMTRRKMRRKRFVVYLFHCAAMLICAGAH
jgi:hypothetical protein